MIERNPNQIIIFDTTLRDGEQSPGAYMDLGEKLLVAERLARAGTDVIETGFPISSPGDYQAVYEIASKGYEATIAGLARAIKGDIEAAANALKPAIDNGKGRIHTFIATSDIHVEGKLRKTFEQVCKMAEDAVLYARTFTDDVEFSAEDAARTDPEKLAILVERVIRAGATTVNIPDTVGYAMPHEIFDQFSYLFYNVPNIGEATISFHGHGDLLNHVANTMAAIMAGARQIEVTINGIGERAGNCPTEAVLGHLAARKDAFGELYTRFETTQIAELSQLVQAITGIIVQPNWPVTGDNAFAHEAGIHQHGVTCDPRTYEIMTPETFGYTSQIIIGARSGKAGVDHKFRTDLGIVIGEGELEEATRRIIGYAERHGRKKMMDDDLLVAYAGLDTVPREFEFGRAEYSGSSKTGEYSATVYMTRDKKTTIGRGTGVGSIDAVINATRNAMHELDPESNGLVILGHNSVSATHETSSEAIYVFTAKEGSHLIKGEGRDPDTVQAAARAYVNLVNSSQFIRNYSRA